MSNGFITQNSNPYVSFGTTTQFADTTLFHNPDGANSYI